MVKILYMFLVSWLSSSYAMEAPADKIESFSSSSSLVPQPPANNLKIILEQQEGDTYIVRSNNIIIDRARDNLFSDNSRIVVGTAAPSFIEECLNNATAKVISLFCINLNQGQIILDKLEATIRLFFIIDNLDGYIAKDRKAWDVMSLYGTLLYSLQHVKKWDHDMATKILSEVSVDLHKRASLFTTLNFNGQDLGLLSRKNKSINPSTFYIGIGNTIIKFLIEAKYINTLPDKPTAKIVKAYVHSMAEKLGMSYRDIIQPLPISDRQQDLIPNYSNQPTAKIVKAYGPSRAENPGRRYIEIIPRPTLSDRQQDLIPNHSSQPTAEIVKAYGPSRAENPGRSYRESILPLPISDRQQDSIPNHSSLEKEGD
jgi:hypothetical protein